MKKAIRRRQKKNQTKRRLIHAASSITLKIGNSVLSGQKIHTGCSTLHSIPNSFIKICIFGLLALTMTFPNAESKTIAAPTTVPSKPAQVSQTVWVAEQQNEFIGNTKLYVANDAVKLVAQEGQVIMLARGPSWNVVVYRPQEKIGFSQTFSNFKVSGLQMLRGHAAFAQAQKKKVFDPKLKVECYEMRSASNHQSFDANDPLIFKSTKKIFEQAMQYRCTSLIALPESVTKFLAAIYRQGDTPGIPIEKHMYLSDGSISTEFCTTALYQKKIPSDFFANPKKFKEIPQNSPDMYISGKSQKNFTDILNSVILDVSQDEKDGLIEPFSHK